MTTTTADIHTAASQIAGAAWDDRERTGTLADQLRAVADMPALGTDGDLTHEDRQALRDLAEHADLVGRLKTYAKARDLPMPAARQELLTIALDHLEARTRGAQARWKGLSPDQRREAATLASLAAKAARDR